ncbi:unnamed protein product [Rotaria socialis]|uniref:Large ribosomal subunit protein mL50 n=2 Tax=Rotaria socialis TaxID=392032 RepID=A0A817LXC7_9BILA|nr:unnamed protein product [Rotaria socialis]CAF3497114.1 unnamed protein product [Rotaria socialis]CAF3799110.1 unnamed protein product [Rotaria socialis]CAF4343003.1 unnamed protein product [Rotaria socialis]CAF4455023.1 unnamed protein product [Rotaria socialis]
MLRFSLLAIHRPCLVNTLVRRTLFGRSSSTEKIKDDFDGEIIEQPDSIPQSAIPTISELASYKTKNYVTRLVTCRPYTPPSNVEQIISRIANETIDNFKEETRSNDNWKSIYLKNPLSKYNLLTRCMKECSHTVSNMTLNDIKTLEDVYQYFSTSVNDTNVLEDLQQSSELPKNVHIQLDAVRFTPETSTFFNELDAFPKRSTKIIDLWYKKKYASYPKNEEDPFKDNIY